MNSGIDATVFSPIWCPEVEDITERIVRKQRQPPGVPIKVRKRDISNAPKRAPLRTDYSAISRHQFDAESSQTGGDITLDWLAFPFGFSAAPAIFALCTEAIQRTHHCMESENGSWSGWEHFHLGISVVDDIFVEADIWHILQEVVAGWEWRCRSLFGPDSINISKIEMECQLPAQGLVLGFDVAADAGTIAVPSPKIEGARIFALSEEFVGSQHISLTELQTLRGYMHRWLLASIFWASCVQPVGLLMAYSSEDGTAIKSPNFSNVEWFLGYVKPVAVTSSGRASLAHLIPE